MHGVAVTHLEQAFLEEASSTMRDHAVTLHLTKSESTVSGAALCWLPRQDLDGPSASRVHLVIDHVLEPLIESRTQEDHDLHLLASEAVVHDLVASQLVAELVQLRRG